MRRRTPREIEKLLSPGPAPEPPADLRARLSRDIPSDLTARAPAPRRTTTLPSTWSAIAAGIVLLLVGHTVLGPKGHEQPPLANTASRTAGWPAPWGRSTTETAPAPRSAPAAPTSPASPEHDALVASRGDETLSAQGFTYDSKGRRDPMESVWDQKKRNLGDRPAGIRGMEIAELDLKGIVITKEGDKYAMVLGADNKGYNLREGDELYNGKVKTIENNRVIFMQKVNDPLSIKEYAEVAKRLEPSESH